MPEWATQAERITWHLDGGDGADGEPPDGVEGPPDHEGPHGPVPEQLDSFVLICYDFEGVIMELFVLCKDARQWSGLLQRSSIGSGL